LKPRRRDPKDKEKIRPETEALILKPPRNRKLPPKLVDRQRMTDLRSKPPLYDER
jgi:hypothetical protein